MWLRSSFISFPLFQPVTTVEIWWSATYSNFTGKMRLGRIGRGQFVHPLPEGRTCSSRSCFILDRWLSDMSLKFLSHPDLLTCFEVSLVESQLNLLQCSYFARVPLAIRICFLACFRGFNIHIFCTCFCFIFTFPAPLLIWNVSFQHLLLAVYVSGLWCSAHLAEGNVQVP